MKMSQEGINFIGDSVEKLVNGAGFILIFAQPIKGSEKMEFTRITNVEKDTELAILRSYYEQGD